MKLPNRYFSRELVIISHQIKAIINSAFLFAMLLLFLPFTLNSESQHLQVFLPALMWFSILFSSILASEKLFQTDFEDGVLEQTVLKPDGILCLVHAKLFMHWLSVIGPMIFLTPLMAIAFHLSFWVWVQFIIILLLATPALLYLCALASAFGLGNTQASGLMALIILPLSIPILIFGSAAFRAAIHHADLGGYLALICAFSLMGILGLGKAISEVLKINVSFQ